MEKEEDPTLQDRLGAVETRLAVVETDLKWVKEKLRSLDNRIWFVVAGVKLTILLQIAFR